MMVYVNFEYGTFAWIRQKADLALDRNEVVPYLRYTRILQSLTPSGRYELRESDAHWLRQQMHSGPPHIKEWSNTFLASS